MEYAREREYSRSQRTAVIILLIQRTKRIKASVAAQKAGCSKRTALRILNEISEPVGIWYDARTQEWVLGYDEWDEEGLTFGQ